MREQVTRPRGTRLFRRLIACVLACSLVGCGSEFGATVTGVVTLDGKPITPGLVTFAPATFGEVPAVGDLDANGRFELTTQKKIGLKPGEYQIAVQAFKPPDLAPGERSFEPSERLIPEKYFQTKTSGLRVTVESGSNTIDLKLTSGSD